VNEGISHSNIMQRTALRAGANTRRYLAISSVVALFTSLTAQAQISPLDSELGDSYYYIDHYEVVIEKPIHEVWPHVLEMGSWMPWTAAEEGSLKISQGDVINLYDDFYIEIVRVIPESMVLLVNLPNSQEAEDTQGMAMLTAKESEGRTLVSLFMSRIYYWFDPGENELRERRATNEFSSSRRSTYKENFLSKLKELAENNE
jgi:hypothetical protein